MTPPRASLRDRLLAEAQAIESRPLHWLPTPQTIALLREAADALPDGWVAVPREPTEAMWKAGAVCCGQHVTRAIQTYSAMIAAAPAPGADDGR